MVQWTIEQHVEMTVGNTSGERIRWAQIQKGWLIKTLAAKVGINSATLSNIERKSVYSVEMKTLRKLPTGLEQPVWYLGCFENMPEDTFFEKIEKARCYHGHTKVEMTSEIGVHARTIDWKDKEAKQAIKEKTLGYIQVL